MILTSLLTCGGGRIGKGRWRGGGLWVGSLEGEEVAHVSPPRCHYGGGTDTRSFYERYSSFPPWNVSMVTQEGLIEIVPIARVGVVSYSYANSDFLAWNAPICLAAVRLFTTGVRPFLSGAHLLPWDARPFVQQNRIWPILTYFFRFLL